MSKKCESFILGIDELINLVQKLPKNGIIILKGNLASGKTTLVKEIAKFHGFAGVVNSPTFSIMQNYKCQNLEIFHYDIYQNGVKSLTQNGLFENFFEDGLHLVEWGDENLENYFQKFELNYCTIEIKNLENKREYKVSYA
ncbi:tRNA (adenosine(37)-N6)-threonylcarbamoyltransferase complex ATPase subunit type 1 TsaE [Campylobacter ureolyticus]|uniref:tRNA (adenosine(37)-N6)-threonylcarbamoyltransferase complex ATPase subunit type 1 TsaE n=1 Tax=Campylobacter ureolyticus TaxID=827 RepID=UPI0029097311|nr:tRNA (adenosine(37)-N6)-threonylcarbamoyltransferase complex ATPase subunit type 1 TsaE [Campylobacter ureolyticus]MDU5326276.1 tRNA (adenosine(37)-N6)-threonylcarbamoyltransferase complex ATPase subunit type 1 TsaE [Campylobacter ureolyticus]